jgi:MYXO-CTERM domain-containing protein
MGSNMFVGMQNYLLVGLYRNLHIGDPNLLYPDGTHVYGTDGAPAVAYVDGVIAGKTKESVLPTDPTAAPTADPTTQAPPGGNPGPVTPTPNTTAPATIPTTTASPFPQGGCSSTGFQSMWLALPLLGLFALRRRRIAA